MFVPLYGSGSNYDLLQHCYPYQLYSDLYRAVNAKWFYLLLYLIAHGTVWHSPLDVVEAGVPSERNTGPCQNCTFSYQLKQNRTAGVSRRSVILVAEWLFCLRKCLVRVSNLCHSFLSHPNKALQHMIPYGMQMFTTSRKLLPQFPSHLNDF